ncbi:MAG: hypothetical protein KF773_23645 [Deltaproteobacteria bacterium]|nr:hypothetical protein [Deltaproteobacteria bacterium]
MPTNPTPTTQDMFAPIEAEALENVAGGARSGDAQLTATLNSITSSIADLAKNQNQTDPMQMMLLVMMMGGGFGGGGGVVAAPGVAGPPVINVDTSVAGGRGFCRMPAFGGCGKKGGKKGW